MKNYTITVNGNVYDVTVEEGASTGAAPAAAPINSAFKPATPAKKEEAPKASTPAPAAAPAGILAPIDVLGTDELDAFWDRVDAVWLWDVFEGGAPRHAIFFNPFFFGFTIIIVI